jgi:hypothetical protein
MSARLSRGAVRRAALVAIASLAAAACDAPTATRPEAEYDPTTRSDGKLYRWESGTTINVWVDPGDTLDVVDVGRAVRSAIGVWNDVPQYREFELRNVSDIGQAHIVVYDAARPRPVEPGSCGFNPAGARGYTYFCPSGTGSPQRAERLRSAGGASTQVSVVVRVDRSQVTSQNGYSALVAHELGHALGIGGHSDASQDLMFGLPTVSAPSFRDALTLRDVLGRRADILL